MVLDCQVVEVTLGLEYDDDVSDGEVQEVICCFLR